MVGSFRPSRSCLLIGLLTAVALFNTFHASTTETSLGWLQQPFHVPRQVDGSMTVTSNSCGRSDQQGEVSADDATLVVVLFRDCASALNATVDSLRRVLTSKWKLAIVDLSSSSADSAKTLQGAERDGARVYRVPTGGLLFTTLMMAAAEHRNHPYHAVLYAGVTLDGAPGDILSFMQGLLVGCSNYSVVAASEISQTSSLLSPPIRGLWRGLWFTAQLSEDLPYFSLRRRTTPFSHSYPVARHLATSAPYLVTLNRSLLCSPSAASDLPPSFQNLLRPMVYEPESPVKKENQNAGEAGWQLAKPALDRQIEGYASLTSVEVGKTITFFVSTSAPHFSLSFFRLGWYGGVGARRMAPEVILPSRTQPEPFIDQKTGLAECCWHPSYDLEIPQSWVSGYYLAKLRTVGEGWEAYIPFAVTENDRYSHYLVQMSSNTFVAYNAWGGRNTYVEPGPQASHVSFNRPFALRDWNGGPASGLGAGEILTANHPSGYPVSPAAWEINVVRFLEREGYDVSYCTNVDVHTGGVELLLRHRAFLSIGHDEYWTWEMRQNVEQARDRGLNLAFLGSNACYWQVRLEPERACGERPYRTLVAHKIVSPDPIGNTSNKRTIRWRDLGMPEDSLLGVMYEADPANDDIQIVDANHWIFHDTGLKDGARLEGLLGYEVDRVWNDSLISTHQILASSVYIAMRDPLNLRRVGHMTMYTAASGALVFASGSMQFAWGLDDYNAPELRRPLATPAVQQMMRNLLRRYVLPPQQRPYTDAGVTVAEVVQYQSTEKKVRPENFTTKTVAVVPHSLISLHLLLVSAGRTTIFGMLDSIRPQLRGHDYLTIVFDNAANDSIVRLVTAYTLGWPCRVRVTTTNRWLGFWGHAARNEFRDLAGDFVLHCDDDDVYLPGALQVVRSVCTDPDIVYFFKFLMDASNPEAYIWREKAAGYQNIGTPSGVVPTRLNRLGRWGYFDGGDQAFYATLIPFARAISFVDYVIYAIRPR